MKKEGETWEISKERRESKKLERLERARNQKEKTLEKLRTTEIQTKITENLKLIPKNRRILVCTR